MEFTPFPKVPRLSRDCVVTEKIDGTNASIWIDVLTNEIKAGSRKRFITPEDDNFGFAKWVEANKEELIAGLGDGTHFGEWWGSGIQRGYGLPKGEKRFSLFNTARWDETWEDCCYVVPILYAGPFDTAIIANVLHNLAVTGSLAAPGYENPEGVMIYHKAANQLFKKTFEKDNTGKEGN